MQGNLRWRERRSRFRRPDEQIRRHQYDVAVLIDNHLAKPFIEQHHYSGSFPPARRRCGLFKSGELVGVAVFGPSQHRNVVLNAFGGHENDSLELGRFVLLDNVPGNGETYFLGQCLRQLKRERFRGVVSFSDPIPRERLNGELVMPGHVGTIYQAGNATFLGRGKRCRQFLLPDGQSVCPRALSKVRNGEQGRHYAGEKLVKYGADDPNIVVGLFYETYEEWLAYWLPRLTRAVAHPGNFKYAWVLNGPRIQSEGRYPKRVVA